MRLPLALLCTALLGAAPPAHAAIATAELVTAFPEPGIWTDPERPGTFLSFDRVGTKEWRARVLEFGSDGGSNWAELHNDGDLEYSHPADSRISGTYALARGSFFRIEGGNLPFSTNSRSPITAPADFLSSPDLAFVNRTTAIWDYRGEARLLKHQSGGQAVFTPNADTVYWLVARDGLKTQSAVVRLRQFRDTNFYELVCVDCQRETGGINMDALAFGTYFECTEQCQAFQFNIFGDEIPLLSLPYRDRFHALALDQNEVRPVEELWLVPVMPTFEWRVRSNPASVAASAVSIPDAVYESTNQSFAYAGQFGLLTGHDDNGQPRWWSLNLTRLPAEFLAASVAVNGNGRFAGSANNPQLRPAEFDFRVVGFFSPRTGLSGRTSGPGAPASRLISFSPAPDLDARTPNTIGLLSLRSRESELLGKVQINTETVLIPGNSFIRTTLTCLDCAQRGARGQRGRGAGELAAVLSRISWIASIDQPELPSILYRDLNGRVIPLRLLRDNRFDKQWILNDTGFASVPPIGLADPTDDAPVEIRFLPVPGLAASN